MSRLPMELALSAVSGEMDLSFRKMDLPCPLKTTKIKSFIAPAWPDLCRLYVDCNAIHIGKLPHSFAWAKAQTAADQLSVCVCVCVCVGEGEGRVCVCVCSV